MPEAVTAVMIAEEACSYSALKFWVRTRNSWIAPCGNGLPRLSSWPAKPPSRMLDFWLWPSMKTLMALADCAPEAMVRSDGSWFTVTPGAKAAKFSHQQGKLALTPQQKIPAGGVLEITVQYAGTPRPVRGPWGEVGWEELTEGALVASQPNGAASWFPCDDHPSSKASYRISITTDSPFYALANGTLVRKQAKASRRKNRK